MKRPGGHLYLLGRAATPGAAETRQFLSRNGVEFRWVDLDDDPLARALEVEDALAGARLPCALFPDGSILEGPERLMRGRFVSAARRGAVPLVSAGDERAHLETKLFEHELAARAGLPTRPRHELYDVAILGAGPARIRAHERIDVRSSSNVLEARGDERLASVVIQDGERGEEVEAAADARFVMIGGRPLRAGVEGWLRRDEHGFLVTGPDLLGDGDGSSWPLERAPLFLSRVSPASSSPGTSATARSSGSPRRSERARWAWR